MAHSFSLRDSVSSGSLLLGQLICKGNEAASADRRKTSGIFCDTSEGSRGVGPVLSLSPFRHLCVWAVVYSSIRALTTEEVLVRHGPLPGVARTSLSILHGLSGPRASHKDLLISKQQHPSPLCFDIHCKQHCLISGSLKKTQVGH